MALALECCEGKQNFATGYSGPNRVAAVAEILEAGLHTAAVATPLQSLDSSSQNFDWGELLEGTGPIAEEVPVLRGLSWLAQACGNALGPFNTFFTMP